MIIPISMKAFSEGSGSEIDISTRFGDTYAVDPLKTMKVEIKFFDSAQYAVRTWIFEALCKPEDGPYEGTGRMIFSDGPDLMTLHLLRDEINQILGEG